MCSIRQVQSSEIPIIEQMQSAWETEYRYYQSWDTSDLHDAIGPYFLVAEQKGVIVGYILADKRSLEEGGVIIHDVYVMEAFRGVGVGHLLVRAVVSRAKSDDAGLCTLIPSAEGADRLAAFYQREGFDWNAQKISMVMQLAAR
jgi:GNAT superfamily N-acetyltransferase